MIPDPAAAFVAHHVSKAFCVSFVTSWFESASEVQ